jgi:hypothetical protein
MTAPTESAIACATARFRASNNMRAAMAKKAKKAKTAKKARKKK